MLRSATGLLLGLRRVRSTGLLLSRSGLATAAAPAPAAGAPPPRPALAPPPPSPPPPSLPLPTAAPPVELLAVRRELDGKRHAQHARRQGLIPGLVYSAASSKGGSLPGTAGGTLKVYVREADLRQEMNRARASFLNTLITLVVDGTRHTVLARDLQLHPFRPKIICCNWYKYTPGKSPGIKVDIPLVAANEERCLAFKEGGWLLQLVHKVRALPQKQMPSAAQLPPPHAPTTPPHAPPPPTLGLRLPPQLPLYAFGDTIPEKLVMDLRGRRMGEKIMASEINLGGCLALRFKEQDFAVAKFVSSGKKGAAVAAEEAPKAAAPAAAAGKAGGGGAAAGAGAGDKGKAPDKPEKKA